MFFQHISDHLLPRWLELNEIVRTGRPASHVNQEEEGAQFFAAFVESLFPISFPAANALGEQLGVPEATSPGTCWTSEPATASGASRWQKIATGPHSRGGTGRACLRSRKGSRRSTGWPPCHRSWR